VAAAPARHSILPVIEKQHEIFAGLPKGMTVDGIYDENLNRALMAHSGRPPGFSFFLFSVSTPVFVY